MKINDKIGLEKPREFYVSRSMYMTNPPKSVAVNERPTEYPDEWIHVREVVPGSVTITREEFMAAWDRAWKKQDPVWFVTIEKELFGE